MSIGQGMFAIKLHELEQQYGQLLSRLCVCQQANGEAIHRELERAREEYAECECLLQKRVEGCRSPMVSGLSAAQRRYCEEARQILDRELPRFMVDGQEDALAGEAEGVSLYAEYAMDFATLSMKQALLAALAAMELQMRAEKCGGNANQTQQEERYE